MGTMIFAHRGASGYAPENTLEAFQLAAEQGADGVELDIQLSRDHQLIVSHDERIDRVSDGSGLICAMTLKEIKSHLFNLTHPEYSQAKAPTLDEVIDLLKPTGLRINIELKNSRLPYAGMEEKCLDLIEKRGMSERVIYSSFNHYSLRTIKQINPNAVCGLLYACCLIKPAEYLSRTGMDAMHTHYSDLLMNPDAYHEVQEQGGLVNVWTVNDDRVMRNVMDFGADIFITDYPDRARAAAG